MSFIETLYDKRCTIYRIDEVEDSTGGMTTNPVEIASNVPCHIRSLRGMEDFDLLGRLGIKATKKIYMSKRALLEKNTIEVTGTTYDIEYIDDKHELDHHMEVWVIERE